MNLTTAVQETDN